ncbi:MAG TPA: hypothetical protein VNV39_18600, partial [Stellaceae bacterium]|nr:hypothetical protein [Stellaceae bacterium]
MHPGDLQPVRLEVVNQHLTEAAFLAQRLLGAGRGAGGFLVLVIRRRGDEGFVAIFLVLAIDIAGCGGATDSRAFDQALVQAEFAVIADCDDAAGAGPVLIAVDREAVDRLVDFAAPFLELRRFGGEFVAPILLANFFEFTQ